MDLQISIIDLINNRILAGAIEEKENYNTIKNFYNQKHQPKDRITIANDK